jgi:hypothetical protein
VIIIIPTNRYGDRLQIASIEAMRTTINEQRSTNIDPMERKNLTEKIIETNRWIAETKRANNSINDIFHPDEVDDIKLLK